MLPEARWWRAADGNRVVCELCSRLCVLAEGKSGYCSVRMNEGGHLRTAVYGFSSGYCVDPMEKKPLYHFLPGTSVLSFGTVGCNLGCIFCQNWSLSDHAPLEDLLPAVPKKLVQAALAEGCSALAFTYNEPAISAEFCIDVAEVARTSGLRTVAVTSGYIQGPAREAFFAAMDGANVDLKGFSESFYKRFCGGRLEPVLETLEYLGRQPQTWLEITTLLIPGANDDPDEIRQLSRWIATHVGTDVPLHFSAFHPDHHLTDASPTPITMLRRAREIALEEGLHYVYLGNVRDREGSSTHCPHCGQPVILRDGFRLEALQISHGACTICGATIPGVFE